MSFHAYLLRCADGSYYAGHTDDLTRRFGQHQRGECGGYTATREEALAAEQQIKGWSRAKKEALMAGDWKRISALAKKSFVKKVSE